MRANSYFKTLDFMLNLYQVPKATEAFLAFMLDTAGFPSLAAFSTLSNKPKAQHCQTITSNQGNKA
jgi:hypothetical protein